MNTEIRSVERAFGLLELLAHSDTPIGVCELADATQLPQATVHRLLATLAKLGYVSQDRGTRRYTLGLRTLSLHGSVLRNMHLGIQAMPVMKALMARVEETVHLAVLSEGEVLYIDRVEGLYTPPSMYTYIGKRAPAHCTALGKALLAHLSCEIVTDVLARRGMRQMTAKTLVTPQAFEQELERTRQRGFAVDDEEIEDGIRCIAAPIRDYTDAVCAAVSISGPKTRGRADRESELSKAVIWAASLISTKLGYLGSQ
jgi:DNA-binding IclR family transcriptional regulator